MPTAHPGTPIDIRPMDLDDLSAVYALGERLFTADRWPYLYRSWEERELLDYYLSDGDTCLVADDGARVVGFAIGCIIEKRRSSWIYGYLGWLGVDPAVQGRQVAKRLLDRMRSLFVEEGVRMMLVDTAATNQRALTFFHRYGFGHDVQHVYLSMNLTQDQRHTGPPPPRAAARVRRAASPRQPMHTPPLRGGGPGGGDGEAE
ncbi:MAG: N-acetyltransferase [Pseudomonadota bacterium]